jgi:hypothetical protein
MKSSKNDRNRIPLDQYVAEMQGFLAREFGIRAGADGIRIARAYHAQGRSPQFCAFALARMRLRPKGP